MFTFRRTVAAGALVLSTLTGGALGAALLNGTASAQTDTTVSDPVATTDTTAATSAASTPVAPTAGRARAARHPHQGGHMANGITEALLTGDQATKVTAAAQAAVPDGTIERVENDAEGATYEAHVTKADGREVTVKLDANFAVTGIEDGAR